MSKKYDVVAVTGKYTDAQGQEKSRYLNIGVILTTKTGGFALKLEAIPVGWDGWAYLNEPKQPEQKQAQQPAKTGTAFDQMKDDIPF